jgi:Tfp pilus assembly protein PilZ
MVNCRIQPRFSLTNQPIENACISFEDFVYPVEMINISRGGTFVRIGRSLPVGAHLDLNFTLSTYGQKCLIPCVVRWVENGSGAGLQFRHLHAVELWGLNRLIQALSTVAV